MRKQGCLHLFFLEFGGKSLVMRKLFFFFLSVTKDFLFEDRTGYLLRELELIIEQ